MAYEYGWLSKGNLIVLIHNGAELTQALAMEESEAYQLADYINQRRMAKLADDDYNGLLLGDESCRIAPAPPHKRGPGRPSKAEKMRESAEMVRRTPAASKRRKK